MIRSVSIFPALILSLTLLSPYGAEAAKKKDKKAGTEMVYHLDTAASTVKWTGTKKVGSHTGTVAVKEGSFQMKEGIVNSGNVVIDLTTIVDTDLTDATYNKKLVTHLKSPDFFDAEKFPTAEFRITTYSEVHNFVAGQPNADVKGDLTIRGVTKPVELKMFVNDTKDGLTAKGKLMVDRTLFGLKYNSKQFFDVKALGDKLINDTFEVDLNLVAKK